MFGVAAIFVSAPPAPANVPGNDARGSNGVACMRSSPLQADRTWIVAARTYRVRERVGQHAGHIGEHLPVTKPPRWQFQDPMARTWWYRASRLPGSIPSPASCSAQNHKGIPVQYYDVVAIAPCLRPEMIRVPSNAIAHEIGQRCCCRSRMAGHANPSLSWASGEGSFRNVITRPGVVKPVISGVTPDQRALAAGLPISCSANLRAMKDRFVRRRSGAQFSPATWCMAGRTTTLLS